MDKPPEKQNVSMSVIISGVKNICSKEIDHTCPGLLSQVIVIINHLVTLNYFKHPFHSQRFPSLDDELYDHPDYKFFMQGKECVLLYMEILGLAV